MLDYGLTLAWARLSGLEARLGAAGRIKKGDLADEDLVSLLWVAPLPG